MKYSEMIRVKIAESGLSLNDIANALRDQGISADKGYISKLQNNAKPPANDKFNEALASVLGIETIELKTAAYAERIPQEVLEKFKS